MKQIIASMFPILGILTGCISQPPPIEEYTGGALSLMQQVSSEPKVIDIEDAIMVDYDSLIADIQYVPLGSEKGVMGQIKRILFHKGIYYIYDFKQDAVFLFDETGKCIKKIDDQGGGPKEYFAIENIDINPVDSELIIVDRLYSQVLFYDLEGNFKYKRKHAAQTGEAYWMKDSTMIYLMYPFQNKGVKELEYYNLIGVQGDSITRKGIKYLPSQIGYCGNDGFIRGYDRSLYYRPLFSDSIYQLHSDSTFSLAYYVKFKNSVWKKHHQSEEFVVMYTAKGEVIFDIFDTEQYLSGYTSAYKTSANGNRMTWFFYDKKHDRTYVSRMKTYDNLKQLDRIRGFDTWGTKGNYHIVTMYGDYIEEFIKEPIKSGKLTVNDPQLKDIIMQMDSDSNPLLVLTKFKMPDNE